MGTKNSVRGNQMNCESNKNNWIVVSSPVLGGPLAYPDELDADSLAQCLKDNDNLIYLPRNQISSTRVR